MSKTSQEWHWEWRRSKWLIFRLFLPLPYTAYPSKLSYDTQNWGWFNFLEQFNEGYLPLEWSNTVTFFGRTIVLRDDAVIDCLIKWVQWPPAVDHSPALNRLCLRAWTQLTYFHSFSASSVFPLHFAMSRISYFIQCPKRHGGVNNFRVTLVSYEPSHEWDTLWHIYSFSSGTHSVIVYPWTIKLWRTKTYPRLIYNLFNDWSGKACMAAYHGGKSDKNSVELLHIFVVFSTSFGAIATLIYATSNAINAVFECAITLISQYHLSKSRNGSTKSLHTVADQ